MLIITGGILLAVLILFALFCLTDQDASPVGIWILVIIGVAFFASSAFAEEYITPRIPSEAEKVEALRLGYLLNGNSMVGNMQGSIDVSGAFNPIDAESNTLRPPANPSEVKKPLRGRKE
jgi:hypothetical protein